MVRPIEREQAGLEADERNRVGCPHGSSEHATGVGIQAARDIEREHRAGLSVDPVDQPREWAFDGSREADAEKAIDDEASVLFRNALGRERNPEESLLKNPG